jgi:transcriptional regulator with XRE-family HTH domain
MNAEIKRRIGKNIKILRERADLTQEEVAARLQVSGCDITRSSLAKIEVGQRHLYPDEIILLKDILSAQYEEIFDIK